MSRADPLSFLDGFTTINKGINSGLAPASLPRDQLSAAINTTFRNGYATSRPGFTRVATNIATGIFQGACASERHGQLVCLVGGTSYAITLDKWQVSNITPFLADGVTRDPNPSNRYRAWLCEAEDFTLIQDGQSPPLIYDGSNTRRADTFGTMGLRELPVGTAMCYASGRLVVASPDGTEFVVGNLVGDQSTGTVNYNFRDSLLRFTDNDIIGQGGAFSVPINCGPITAIRPVAQVDTSTGQGATQIMTVSAIFSLNAPSDRTTWQTLSFPIQTVGLVGAGALSDRATVNVNGDIWTRAYDGIRSFIVARREFTYMWANAPMSQELTRWLKTDDVNLLSYASAAVFDNRLLLTVNPYRAWNQGIAHRGLAVIDFAHLAYLSDHTIQSIYRGGAIWEGIWTGLQILQVVAGNFQGRERCFVFALTSGTQLDLWELTKSNSFDNLGSSYVPIQWSVETGGLTFPRAPQQSPAPSTELISLDGGRLYVDQLEGTVSFTASYHLDQDPCWYDWWDWSVCASNQLCEPQGSLACITPLTFQQQYRKPFYLPTPREAKDPVTGKNLNYGREAQARLSMTGKCRLKRFEAVAHDAQDTVNTTPAATETCQPVTCAACANDYTYSIV